MLARSPSEVRMVKTSEYCVSGWSGGGFGSAVIMRGVFALVTRCCERRDIRIYIGAVGVDEVWVLVVGVGVMFLHWY